MTTRDHLNRLTSDCAHPIQLGCSTITHDRLGYCATCLRRTEGPDAAAALELSGWRLLAMADQEDGKP